MKSNPDNSKQKEPQKTNPNGKKDNLQKRKAKDSAKPEQTPGSDTKQNQGPSKSFKNDRGGEAGKAEIKANKRKVNGSLPESNKQVTKKRKIEEPAEKKPTE